jgi:phytoene dehydrogenase-like protein
VSGYDVVFLGSSPNALAAAARLGRAGLRVLVLETREVAGGPVATEAFAPGFRADTGVMSASLDPEIARELGVSIDVIRRDSVTALGPEPLTLRALPELPEAVSQAVELLRALHRSEPPEVPALAGADLAALHDLGARLAGFGGRAMHEVLRLLFMSARDFFEEQVGCGTAGAVLCGAAVRALSEGPFAQGTLFGFLHHAAVDDGLFRCTARGGLGALVGALSEVARAAGVEIRTGVPGPIQVDVEDGAARGVHLGDGARIAAEIVVSDHDARTTFTRLVHPRELDPETNRAIRAVRYRGSVARVHLALRGSPELRGVDADALRGTLVLAPDVASIERAWDQAKRGAVPSRPYVEIAVPTASDPTLAPEGQHVLDAWVQYIPHGRGDRQAVLKSVLDLLAPLAPGLQDLVLHHHVSLPEDLERRFGLPEGQLYGGEIRLEQAFFLRPIPGYSHHESPIANLYLGGSAAHPGGYSGRSGWNLAGRLLGQRERQRASRAG